MTVSAWDGVPWAIGGGAKHSTDLARNLAYLAVGGRQGIANPTDLQVRELAVPGAAVRVAPGGCSILCQALGVTDEMYIGRLPTEDTASIAPTDSLGGRSDLVIARVENPYMTGETWPAPSDPLVGPYIFTRVIQGVPATTTSVDDLGLGYSALTLARIDIPASTGTITQGMIVDLRNLSQAHSERTLNIAAPTVSRDLTSGTFTNWPSDANYSVKIPKWATHMNVLASLAGIGYGAAGNNGGSGWNVVGDLRIQLGVNASDANYSQSTKYNLSVDAGSDRASVLAGASKMVIPANLRGKTATIRIEGRKQSGNTNLTSDGSSTIALDVEFLSAVESN